MPGNDALAFTTAVNTLAAAMDALAAAFCSEFPTPHA